MFLASNSISELRRQLYMQMLLPWIIGAVISAILIYVASALGLMKMFEKAGEAGWKAWVPFYNLYILVKLCWNPIWFWPVVGAYAFIAIFGNLRVGNPMAIIFAVIIVLLAIALLVWKCYLSYCVAKKFNKGMGWVVGLVLLDWLFCLLLGFGSAQYGDAKPLAAEAKPKPKMAPAKKTTPKKAATKTPNRQVKKPTARKAPSKPATDSKKVDYIDPKPKAKF